MIEAKEIVIETCEKVMKHYAKRHQIPAEELKIRIDLENVSVKPVFGVFKAGGLLERATLKQIVRAGGGGPFSMLIGVSVQNIIKDIFVQSLKQLELKDSRRIFLILRMAKEQQGAIFPSLALYQDGKLLWTLSVSQIMEATMAQTKEA